MLNHVDYWPKVNRHQIADIIYTLRSDLSVYDVCHNSNTAYIIGMILTERNF